MKIIKRDGTETQFNKTKIKQAVVKAMRNGSGIYLPDIARLIANDAERYFADEKDFCDDRMGELADMNLNVMTVVSDGSKSMYQIASEVAPFIFGRD